MPAAIQHTYTGGASNSDPNASLGGVSSSVELAAAPLNNLYADVQPADATAGVTHYRAIDIKNVGDATGVGVEAYMDPETTSTDTQIDMGIEASPLGSSLSIPDEDTAPAGVSFAHYNDASRLALPDIPDGQYCRLWLRRVVSPGATNDPLDQGDIVTPFA